MILCLFCIQYFMSVKVLTNVLCFCIIHNLCIHCCSIQDYVRILCIPVCHMYMATQCLDGNQILLSQIQYNIEYLCCFSLELHEKMYVNKYPSLCYVHLEDSIAVADCSSHLDMDILVYRAMQIHHGVKYTSRCTSGF